VITIHKKKNCHEKTFVNYQNYQYYQNYQNIQSPFNFNIASEIISDIITNYNIKNNKYLVIKYTNYDNCDQLLQIFTISKMPSFCEENQIFTKEQFNSKILKYMIDNYNPFTTNEYIYIKL
jgi:F0F1-type ATP synthase gamma subunit